LLFDEANVFDPHRRIVGLRPLWRDAEDVCKTGDIPGLHPIRISVVYFFAMS